MTPAKRDLEVAAVRRDDLNKLAGFHQGPCVSIYSPAGAGTRPVERMSQLLKGIAAGVQRTEGIRDLVALVQNALGDLSLPVPAGGAAVFVAPGFARRYGLSFEVPDLAVIAERFDVKPLLPAVYGGEDYYLLALSPRGARLFSGTRKRLTPAEIALPQMHPLQNAAAAGNAKREGAVRRFISQTMRPGREPGAHALLSYLRAVDEAVRGCLADAAKPVVLRGSAHLCTLYRRVSSLQLLECNIDEGSDDISPVLLHLRSLAAAASSFPSLREEAADEYFRLWHTSRVSNDLLEISVAARDGRVKALWLPSDLQGENTCRTREAAAAAQLDIAVIQTYLHGGTVFTVPPELAPGRGPVAALFRY